MRSIISIWLLASCTFLCVLTLPQSAFALSPADINAASQESSRIQREEQLRQREDMQRSIQNNREPTYIETPEVSLPKGKGEGCQKINEVQVTGAENMPDKVVVRITQKYALKCLGVNEIQTLLGEITAYYIDKGFATTRAYLPSQDLSTGVLKIQVIEGRLKKVEVDEKSEGTVFLGNAFPFVNDRVLNLRDIEQGVDQINKLPSNNVTVDIVPGAKAGESTILIKNEPGKRWHVTAGADNYGTKSTGRYQGSTTIGIDNLFGLNEFYSFTRRETIPTDGDDRNTESNSLLFSVPFGYTTLLAGYSDSTYDSVLVTPSGLSVNLEGLTRSTFVTLDHTVYRDKLTKGGLSATITGKNNKNYVQNSLLAVSSHQLTILDLGANVSSRIGDTATTLGITYSRGLNIFGAEEDLSGLPGSAPRAQFQKIGFNASQSTPFRIKERNFMWSSQFTGQVGLDTLLGSEQFSIGGVYTVRGFYEDTLANDHGYYLRNDISMPTTVNLFGKELNAKPYFALDTGYVSGRASGTPSGNLVGTAIGSSLARGPVSFDIYTGLPIIAPERMDNDGFNTFSRLSVSF